MHSPQEQVLLPLTQLRRLTSMKGKHTPSRENLHNRAVQSASTYHINSGGHLAEAINRLVNTSHET